MTDYLGVHECGVMPEGIMSDRLLTAINQGIHTLQQCGCMLVPRLSPYRHMA